MAVKLWHVAGNVNVGNVNPGYTFDPALRDIVGGVEQAVAPDLVFAVPKAAAASCAVPTVLATGNIVVDQNNAVGNIAHDILAIRFHSIQRVTSGANKILNLLGNSNVAAAPGGTDVDPALTQAGVAIVPDIVIPVPKAVPTAATAQSYVPTVLATGAIKLINSEAAGNVAHDVAFLRMHTIQRTIAAVFGQMVDRRRYFTILNTAAASKMSIYADAADATRQFRVQRAKVPLDGSLQLNVTQVSGTTFTALTGNLNLVSGTGDAVIAFTNALSEKLAHLEQNVAVSNAGTAFNPNLCVNGTPVMPDIVIPVPKEITTVSYVPTVLSGAFGPVTVRHQNAGGNRAHDILFLRLHSIFRVP